MVVKRRAALIRAVPLSFAHSPTHPPRPGIAYPRPSPLAGGVPLVRLRPDMLRGRADALPRPGPRP